MTYVIAANRIWRPEMIANVKRRAQEIVAFIGEKHMLTPEHLDSLGAHCIFFPHWSYLIPPKIYERYECIVFHMTDLPFGRGGSPLQNLIARGIYETKISALLCVRELDAGPIYSKRPLSLYGSAQEIYMRAGQIVEDMIVDIMLNHPEPQEQSGEVVFFPRRQPQDGDIAGLETLGKVYDFIRMLDADGYPPAFIETDDLRFEFSRASLKSGYIQADVTIKKKFHEE